MVSPFPPLRDGVGKYAAQEVAALRGEGNDVEVLAPVACAAHHVVDLKTWRGGLFKLRRYARRYDRVVLQYQPANYHHRAIGFGRALSNFWMGLAFRRIKNLTVVCHEVEYPPRRRSRWRPGYILQGWAWRGARNVEFHTEHEVAEMERRFGATPRRVELRPHGRYFRPATDEDRQAARERLGIDAAVKLFLCIGFIQSHKGFDSAIRAFRRVPGDARLVVIGSIRSETHDARSYFYGLLDLAAGDGRIGVHERMLSDEEFDRWIIASDVVLLPYLQIWSSGVLERARVLGRPVIATRTGGLSEQTGPQDLIVSGEDELATAIADIVGEGSPAVPTTMSVGEAIAFVAEEADRRRPSEGAGGVDRALYQLEHARGVEALILPSSRRLIGRVLDLVKRVARRGLGWLLTPMLGQIDHFQKQTIEAFDALVAEQRRTDPSQYAMFDYESFERRFRGDSEALKEHQKAYVDEFVGREPVLDVGCGRGEFLELLREAGIEARGIDISMEMVLAARRRRLDVDHGDGVAYLRGVQPGTLGGIMASQVVEHMAPRALVEFLAASRRALRGGGILVCETINPQSLYAMANWYVMDLTHAQPIHPHTLSFLAESAGFSEVQVRYLSPAKPEREPITIEDDAPAWALRLAKSVDEELRAQGDVVFGPQDYAIIARVPGA